MLATLWWPDTDPFGFGMFASLAFVVAYVVMTWATGSQEMLIMGAGLFSVVTLADYVLGFSGRSFPDADDFVGFYILNLAAVCFALDVARLPSRACFWVGSTIVFFMGWFLAGNVLDRYLQSAEWRRVMTDMQRLGISLAGWCVIFAPLFARVYWQRRSRAGG